MSVLNNASPLHAASHNPDAILGSAIGLIMAALLTVLVALLLYLELVLRTVLILVTTTFIPIVAIMAIWPRFSGTAIHLAEFLVALLLSKFVIATAIFLGFHLVTHGVVGGAAIPAMVTGLAALLVAAFSPLVLLQGIRVFEGSASNLSRSWATSGIKTAAGGGLLGAATNRLTTHSRAAVGAIR